MSLDWFSLWYVDISLVSNRPVFGRCDRFAELLGSGDLGGMVVMAVQLHEYRFDNLGMVHLQ